MDSFDKMSEQPQRSVSSEAQAELEASHLEDFRSEPQEWTPNYVARLYAFADGSKSSHQIAAMTRTFISGWQAIADAHNAALVAEREKLEKGYGYSLGYSAAKSEYEEKVKLLLDALEEVKTGQPFNPVILKALAKVNEGK